MRDFTDRTGVTTESIQLKLECKHDTACEVMDLCEYGYYWGTKGLWPDGDFSSDADWCNGPGEKIQKIELLLECDGTPVFDMFCEAWSAGVASRENIEQPQLTDPVETCRKCNCCGHNLGAQNSGWICTLCNYR